MSTNDWKAELRRRIQDIREKKAAEKSRQQRLNPQPVARGAAAPAVMPTDEAEPERLQEPAFAARPVAETIPTPTQEAESEIPEEDEAVVVHQDEPQEIVVIEEHAEIEDRPLFTMEPLFTVEDEDTTDAEDREQAQAQTAAPAASDLEAAVDVYAPLEAESQAEPEVQIRQAEESVQEDALEIPVMRNLRRILASVVDILIVAATVGAILTVAAGLLDADPVNMLFQSVPAFTAMAVCIHFVYYTLFTGMTGQTPGKIVFRLRVSLNDNTKALGILRAIGRWLAGAAAVIPAAAGYLWMYSRPDGRSWHDILLRMQVVDFRPSKSE